ncbi:MAG: SiaC family regulatory phosphoprotein [Bacteroidales bacterium]|nr:SiaC family regulatory phosphoprotein [Bacteroidales bacterium]
MTQKTEYFEIKGSSIPENSVEFYKPLNEWLDNHMQISPDKTVVEYQAGVFQYQLLKNASLTSSKRLRLHSQCSKHDVDMNWFYEEDDEDMLEAGED